MIKISISGKANTGKNTVGKILSELLRKKIELNEHLFYTKYSDCYLDTIKVISFADPIKEMALKMFPNIPRNHLFGSSKYRSEIILGAHKNGEKLTIRQLLIDIGKQGREYNPDIWINAFDNNFSTILKNRVYPDYTITKAVICPDNRFRNEHSYLKNNGFYQIRILRNNYSKIDDVSETNQDEILDNEFDYILKNNHSLNKLKEEIERNIIPMLISY